MSVVLVDDHPLLSLGLVQGLAARGIDAMAVPPASPRRFVPRLMEEVGSPDLVVLDLSMPEVPDTPELVAELVAQGLRVLMLSGSEDTEGLARCLVAGALGIVSKDETVSAILDTIERAASGQVVRPVDRVDRLRQFEEAGRVRRSHLAVFDELTRSEEHVLRMLAEGRCAASIAEVRFVSLPTVRSQIKAILAKLGVSSQLEAVALAHRSGWMERATA